MQRCTLSLIGGQAWVAVARRPICSGNLAKACPEGSRSDERSHGMDVGAHRCRLPHSGRRRVRQPDEKIVNELRVRVVEGRGNQDAGFGYLEKQIRCAWWYWSGSRLSGR